MGQDRCMGQQGGRQGDHNTGAGRDVVGAGQVHGPAGRVVRVITTRGLGGTWWGQDRCMGQQGGRQGDHNTGAGRDVAGAGEVHGSAGGVVRVITTRGLGGTWRGRTGAWVSREGRQGDHNTGAGRDVAGAGQVHGSAGRVVRVITTRGLGGTWRGQDRCMGQQGGSSG